MKHSSYEKKVFAESCKHLFESESVKTVIVDILERDSEYKVLTKDNRVKDVHSVVLYKNKIDSKVGYEIIVIDPSNFTFSSHLYDNSQLD